MMKKFLISTFLFLITISLYSQNYYEVPYVGKRSVLTKLNESDKNLFIKQNNIKTVFEIPRHGEKDHYGFFNESENEYLVDHDIYAELMDCYKEDIPDENGKYVLSVYRIMYDFKKTTKLNLNEEDNTERKCCGQVIYVPVNGKYVQYEKFIYFGTERFDNLMSSYGVEAQNFQFRIVGDEIFAFNINLSLKHNSRGYDEETFREDISKQNENYIYKTKISNIMDKTTICEVKIDYPLIDKNNPFKYSVQNAFDGDPSTSYVEDTENDLFEMNIDFTNYPSEFQNKQITEIEVINGYASNSVLYSENNRIKNILYDFDKNEKPIYFLFEDKNIEKQKVINFNSSQGWLWFEVTSVYEGSKYSDTSLAEIDFKFKTLNYFFGVENVKR